MSYSNYTFSTDTDKQDDHLSTQHQQRTLDFRDFRNQFESTENLSPVNIGTPTSAAAATLVDRNQKALAPKNSPYSSFPVLSSPWKDLAEDSVYKYPMAPPPQVYCARKQPLLEFAKLYANLHGYRLVTVKNDNKRCILRCAKHLVKETYPYKRRPEMGNENGATHVSMETEVDKADKYAPEGCASCDFRIEIQLKKRKELWLLKPLTSVHNHTDMISLPHMFSGYVRERDFPKTNREDIVIEKFCQCSNHMSCAFEENFYYLPKLFGTPPGKVMSELGEGDIRILNDPQQKSSDVKSTEHSSPNLNALYSNIVNNKQLEQGKAEDSGSRGLHQSPLTIPRSASLNNNGQLTTAQINDALSRDLDYSLLDATQQTKKARLNKKDNASTIANVTDERKNLNFKMVIRFSINHLSVLLELQNFIILKNNDCLDYLGLEYSFVPLTRNQMISNVLGRSQNATGNVDVDCFIFDLYDISDKDSANLIKSNIVTVYNYDEMFNVIRTFSRFLREKIKHKFNIDLAESFL